MTVSRRKKMKIFDLHADIACALQPYAGEKAILKNHWQSRLAQGEIGVTSAASFFSGSQSWQQMQQTVEAVKKDIEESGYRPILTKEELPEDPSEPQYLMTIEGMCGIHEDPEEKIGWLYAMGNRIGSLCWNDQNDLATGNSGSPGRGLTELGRRAVRKMNELHMIVDVSHANEKTFWDLLDESSLPLIATHSNAKALCFVERNLTDQQIRALAEKGGLIGMNACAKFIDADPEKQDGLHLAEHARYIADLAGIEHVACGFDFSAYYTEASHDMSGPEKAQNFIEGLRRCGFSEDEIKDIAYRNVLRFLQKYM